MEENKEQQMEQPKKLSYEQLEEVAKQLSEQSRQLYMELQNANMTNTFKRLDYLFKVLENDISFGEDFVSKCADEVKQIMYPPEESEEAKEDNK